jgi:hypothetical protein
LLSEILAMPFRLAVRLRRARAVHPKGRTYAGMLWASGRLPALDGGTGREVIVRVSKVTPTPGGLPDVLGIALRIPTGVGPVDLLFATTGKPPGLRHLPRARGSFTHAVYTTLLLYDIGGQTRVLALLPATARRVPGRLDLLDGAVTYAPLVFNLATATLTGPWEPCGTLEIRTPLPAEPPLDDAFDPQLNSLPGLRPTRPRQALRRLTHAVFCHGRGRPTPFRRAAR